MKIVEIREEAELSKWQAAWSTLLERSASATIFLTWEWVTSWWTAYGTPGDLRVLLAIDDVAMVRGIAPLRRQMVRRYGQSYSTLAFIGDGSADSDYLDFIIAAGDEAAVMEAFSKHWEGEMAHGTLLQLDEIPESSPNLAFLQALSRRDGMVWSTEDVACSSVLLPGDWQAYLGGLQPRFRTRIRSVLRNLEVRGDVRFQFCDDPRHLDRLLPSLFELHRRRWAKEAKPGVFQWDKKQQFYRDLSPRLLERGWLGFSWLEWNGRILASQYGFVYHDRYFQLQEGYDPECEHLNAGIGLRAWSIQQLLKRGITEYDFLAGVGRHKSDWGSTVKQSKRIVLGSRQAKNILFCRGPEWELRARHSVKSLVPKGFLAARDARQEQDRVAAFRRRENSTPAATPWIRNALASCYFHSPLPEILPPLRNRYRLHIAANGHGPKVSLEKRGQPSARILYFHRVNDDGDPFIGGLSTAVFEREMKFVSQHYQVVSLTEATRRLAQGGPPEPVIAITFDDGYQDNYLRAFPILQRYGLPATIFLTTGSVDSRERPWFEQLSLAAKRTSQTFIDLEIDLPRRLPLRTDAERLAAKNLIIALVREVPDTERRRWIADVIARLGTSTDTEDTMLTWDQIRLMKQRRIDFGGHTVTHPFVSRLAPEEAVREVSECKRRIEEELQSEVEHFAYPNGREGDFEPWNKRVLQEAGYRAAVSTLWGVNYPSTDLMELRRGQPWEESLAVFAAKLDWYQWMDI
jgi:peptidoglycan/xylan/chitin deacetylase (PgdA/CDA1 family)/CelD/BcsL family acetyltransferase involved in cellulose biosynthesis